MGKGIIRNDGSGGTAKLVLTDFDPKFFAKAIRPGVELVFTTKDPVKEGFLVQGDIVDDGKGNYTFNVTSILNNNPTIISGSSSGNVTIGVDQVYLVTSTGKIGGNATVDGGVLLVVGGTASGNITIGSNSTIICNTGATVTGGTFKISAAGVNSCVVIENSSVNGAFSTNGITYVNLNSNDHNGNVSSDSDSYVEVTNNIVKNNFNLTVKSVVTECNVKSNTVGGQTSIDPKCAQ